MEDQSERLEIENWIIKNVIVISVFIAVWFAGSPFLNQFIFQNIENKNYAQGLVLLNIMAQAVLVTCIFHEKSGDPIEDRDDLWFTFFLSLFLVFFCQAVWTYLVLSTTNI